MQEFTFHSQHFLGGGPPKPPIAGGGHSLPHILPSPLRCSITIVDGKNSHPPFQNPGYGSVQMDCCLYDMSPSSKIKAILDGNCPIWPYKTSVLTS
ncbi:hypothetical protein DPMN_074555 [Dreissena polymorpha]|uniref:Uncharacterized protein n=1 Tax=Dreissena polymorpha TaxID=45954 RepID=A0A9D3YFL5_DREPO|nr:hypothetical protein DPMN_074555 [Dreissena polymorpha]